MKKLLLLLLLWASGTISSSMGASTYVGLTAGDLTDQFGAALPANSLLILIASGSDASFSNALGAGQFVSGDDVALAMNSVNNNLGGIQTTSNDFNLSTGVAGQALAIRWFSDFTYQQYLNGETPAAGTRYGTFAGQTTGTPNGGMAWVFPSPGGAVTINFATQSANSFGNLGLNDAYANSVGQALSVVAVPEPRAYALAVGGLLCGLIFFRRRARASRELVGGSSAAGRHP